jgi:bifunctional non-homologous end joining protein LigD
VKWDGLRGQLRHDGRRTTLRSRNGRDLSSGFPELVGEAAARLGRRPALLDAEIVCLNSRGRRDFAAVRARMHEPSRDGGSSGAGRRSRLVVFELLHLEGPSTRHLAYAQRRSVLEDLGIAGGRWIVPEHFVDGADQLIEVTREHSLEGVVLKRLAAPYAVGRRSGAWVKHKHRRHERAVVLGCRSGDGAGLDAFILGREDRHGNIRYAGEASFGLTSDDRERIRIAMNRSRRPSGERVRVVVAGHG